MLIGRKNVFLRNATFRMVMCFALTVFSRDVLIHDFIKSFSSTSVQ